VALVKVRVLLDLQAIQNATRAIRGTMPQEIIELIRRQLVGSAVEPRPEILMSGTDEIACLVETIKGQLRQLYKSINQCNPHFWRSMLNNPAAAIADRPDAYSPGSREEACLILGYNFAAWAETPGAMDTIRTLSQAV
jgi:hypothetical protein